MKAWTAGLTSVEAAGVVPLIVDAAGGLGHKTVRLRAGGHWADIALLGGVVPARDSPSVSLAAKSFHTVCDHANTSWKMMPCGIQLCPRYLRRQA